MDDVDEEILSILRQDGRRSFTAVGRDVGLSANAVAARVQRLERTGIIAGFTVVLADAVERHGGRVEAFIDVRLRHDRDSEDFLAWAAHLDGVAEAVHVTGPYDYLLRVRIDDMRALDRLLRALKNEGGASQTQTRIALG
jgi:Lrp/AsnC family leucine-responsive transcriptional regulator